MRKGGRYDVGRRARGSSRRLRSRDRGPARPSGVGSEAFQFRMVSSTYDRNFAGTRSRAPTGGNGRLVGVRYPDLPLFFNTALTFRRRLATVDDMPTRRSFLKSCGAAAAALAAPALGLVGQSPVARAASRGDPVSVQLPHGLPGMSLVLVSGANRTRVVNGGNMLIERGRTVTFVCDRSGRWESFG